MNNQRVLGNAIQTDMDGFYRRIQGRSLDKLGNIIKRMVRKEKQQVFFL